MPLLSPEPRLFPGQRWVNILLRTLHLVGFAGVGGGFLFGLDEALWLPWWSLTLASGVGLTLLYLYTDLRWLLQLKGLAVIVKLLLLGTATLHPAWRAELFVAVVVISGVVAHAPGRVRGWRLI